MCRKGQGFWLEAGFRFGTLWKAVQDVSFLSKQHEILLTHAHCFVFSRLPGFSELAPKCLQGLRQAELNSLRGGSYEQKSCLGMDSASQSTFCLPYTKSLCLPVPVAQKRRTDPSVYSGVLELSNVCRLAQFPLPSCSLYF